MNTNLERKMVADPKPKHQIIQMVLNVVLARAVHTAADLGIADLLNEEPQDAETLAEKIGAHTPSLKRLMRMLTAHKIFTEDANGKFSLTPLGECLRSDGKDSLRDYILLEDEARWRAMGKLKSSVINGTPAFDQIYGKSYFEYLASDTDMNSRFEAGMTSLTDQEDSIIASAIHDTVEV